MTKSNISRLAFENSARGKRIMFREWMILFLTVFTSIIKLIPSMGGGHVPLTVAGAIAFLPALLLAAYFSRSVLAYSPLAWRFIKPTLDDFNSYKEELRKGYEASIKDYQRLTNELETIQF